ncbi:MAG TPA: DNA polymerase III subunit beta [Ktedonobacteraceae bacterium]|nr:DNA polymerase III subunit beta [Ktedonobacteraceae bacterium]
MHVICQQRHLAQNLAAITHALGSKQYTLPILTHVLLSAEEPGTLHLFATNLEIGIALQLDAEILEPGKIALPAKLLHEIVQNFSEVRVELCVPEDSTTARLSTIHTKTSLRGMDAAEFPKLPERDEAALPIVFGATQLKEYIGQVAFAAGTDDGRPVLQGISVQLREEEVTLAASDAIRLAVRREKREVNEEEPALSDILIPARSMIELARILPAEGEVTMTISLDRTRVHFQAPKLAMVSRLIEGIFPPFQSLIPATYTTRAVLDRAEFAAAIKSVALFAEAHVMVLTIKEADSDLGNGTLLLDSAKEDLGDSESILDASVEGPPIQIRFGTKYLLDALDAMNTPTVALETTTHQKPGILRPVGELASPQFHVIMPMNKL